MNAVQLSGQVEDVEQLRSRKGTPYARLTLRLHERERDPEKRWRPQRPVLLRVFVFQEEVPQVGAQIIVWGHLGSREFTSGRPEVAILADTIRAYVAEVHDSATAHPELDSV